MGQVKSNKKGILLDMTAMCDVAFLLLTFFILTAKMKVPEPARFEVPSSISDTKLPDDNVMRISISNEGVVFFAVSDQGTRREVIQEIDKMYNLGLTSKQKLTFELTETFGVPMAELPFYLGLPEDKRNDFKQKGIVMDSTNNELKGWVRVTKTINPNMRIAVKGDRDAEYVVFSKVLSSLQEMRLNKFSLITSMEAKPSVE